MVANFDYLNASRIPPGLVMGTQGSGIRLRIGKHGLKIVPKLTKNRPKIDPKWSQKEVPRALGRPSGTPWLPKCDRLELSQTPHPHFGVILGAIFRSETVPETFFGVVVRVTVFGS